jgi:site-specific recombinase
MHDSPKWKRRIGVKTTLESASELKVIAIPSSSPRHWSNSSKVSGHCGDMVQNASFWFIIRIVRATIVAAIFESNVRHIVRAQNVSIGFANGSGKVKLSTFFPAIKMMADLRLIHLVVSEI